MIKAIYTIIGIIQFSLLQISFDFVPNYIFKLNPLNLQLLFLPSLHSLHLFSSNSLFPVLALPPIKAGL